jgi:hypothetical protein
MIINNKRALAYIQHVTNIRPIDGADNIEQCNVLGWNLICKKGEFHEGDPCVYIEIDSKVPEREEFEFLRAKGFKVKTMKLGKFNCISQGLAMPQSAFKELAGLSEGTDVTDILGIKYSVQEDNARKSNGDPNAKYKSMAARHQKIFKKKWARWMMRRSWGRKVMFFFFGKKKDNPRGFPSFVSKTDEERVENQPWRISDGKTYIATEKLDGTSCTYALERKGRNKFEFYVCSRNVRQQDEKQECYHDHNIYWDLAFKYNIEQHLKDILNQFPKLKWVCIQGEGVGSVQGNPLKLKEDDLYVFNFKDSERGRYNSIIGRAIIEKMGMKWVPILGKVQMPDTMEELKALATGKSKVNPDVMREGIVYRSLDGSDSFKNVSREYLLKHNN